MLQAADKGVSFKTTSRKTTSVHTLFVGQIDPGLIIAVTFRMFLIPSNRKIKSNWFNSKGNQWLILDHRQSRLLSLLIQELKDVSGSSLHSTVLASFSDCFLNFPMRQDGCEPQSGLPHQEPAGKEEADLVSTNQRSRISHFSVIG